MKYLDHFYTASGFEMFTFIFVLTAQLRPNLFDIMKYLDHFYTASGFEMFTFIFVLTAQLRPNLFDIMKYLDHFYTASGFEILTFPLYSIASVLMCLILWSTLITFILPVVLKYLLLSLFLQHSFSPNLFDIMKYLDHFYITSGFEILTFIVLLYSIVSVLICLILWSILITFIPPVVLKS